MLRSLEEHRPVIWRAGLVAMLFSVTAMLRAASDESPSGASDPRAGEQSPQRPTASVMRQPPSSDSLVRLPVPSLGDQRAVEQKLRELFERDFANATDGESKAKLAHEFHSHAAESPKASEKFVLLSTATRLAADAGEAGLVFRGIDELARQFQIDLERERLQLLETMGKSAPVEKLPEVCALMLNEARARADTKELDAAEQLAKAAAMAARRSRSQALQRQAVDVIATIRKKQKAASVIEPNITRLQRNPRDAEAATRVGIHYCLEQNDWERGLQVLAQSDDTDLAKLAAAEVTKGGESKAAALGDGWYAFAKSRPPSELAAWLSRAEFHYLVAVEPLTGLEKVRVSRRLAAIAEAHGSEAGSEGLILHLDAANLATVNSRVRAGTSGRVPVTAWRSQVGRTAASPCEDSRPPEWSSTAYDGRAGVIFEGRSRLAIPVALPAEGTIILVCKPTMITNHRAVSGSVRILLRADSSFWLEYKTQQATSTVRTPPNAYAQDKPTVVAATWSQPFWLLAGGEKTVTKTGTASAAPLAHDPFLLGGGFRGSTEAFHGVVRHLLVYSRVLDPAEVAKTLRSLDE